MSLIAKPVINNKYWILTDDNGKVGNVVSDGSGYEVKIGDSTSHYESTSDIKNYYNVHFQIAEKPSKEIKPITLFGDYPTPLKSYNSILDIKRKLHIFTKTPASKCYYVAGFFSMKLDERWETIFSPKYIFVQRYQYFGPYKTKKEADEATDRNNTELDISNNDKY